MGVFVYLLFVTRPLPTGPAETALVLSRLFSRGRGILIALTHGTRWSHSGCLSCPVETGSSPSRQHVSQSGTSGVLRESETAYRGEAWLQAALESLLWYAYHPTAETEAVSSRAPVLGGTDRASTIALPETTGRAWP